MSAAEPASSPSARSVPVVDIGALMAVERIAHRLMMLVAVTLGEKSDFFDQFFYRTTRAGRKDKNTNSMRLNYYPKAPNPEETMAPLHRVLANGASDRFSAPFFHNPSFAADIRPVLVDALDTPKYKKLNWKQYIYEKVAGNFANLAVEDAHISHYRIGNAT
ncbi:hypothetical protein PybrP1_008255 [[Pythium] brassicae (nom. inval.)]|nr:hypothetical protein PybrP1_008255 [[Pythium] brassicae (nom. inval.)]